MYKLDELPAEVLQIIVSFVLPGDVFARVPRHDEMRRMLSRYSNIDQSKDLIDQCVTRGMYSWKTSFPSELLQDLVLDLSKNAVAQTAGVLVTLSRTCKSLYYALKREEMTSAWYSAAQMLLHACKLHCASVRRFILDEYLQRSYSATQPQWIYEFPQRYASTRSDALKLYDELRYLEFVNKLMFLKWQFGSTASNGILSRRNQRLVFGMLEDEFKDKRRAQIWKKSALHGSLLMSVMLRWCKPGYCSEEMRRETVLFIAKHLTSTAVIQYPEPMLDYVWGQKPRIADCTLLELAVRCNFQILSVELVEGLSALPASQVPAAFHQRVQTCVTDKDFMRDVFRNYAQFVEMLPLILDLQYKAGVATGNANSRLSPEELAYLAICAQEPFRDVRNRYNRGRNGGQALHNMVSAFRIIDAHYEKYHGTSIAKEAAKRKDTKESLLQQFASLLRLRRTVFSDQNAYKTLVEYLATSGYNFDQMELAGDGETTMHLAAQCRDLGLFEALVHSSAVAKSTYFTNQLRQNAKGRNSTPFNMILQNSFQSVEDGKQQQNQQEGGSDTTKLASVLERAFQLLVYKFPELDLGKFIEYHQIAEDFHRAKKYGAFMIHNNREEQEAISKLLVRFSSSSASDSIATSAAAAIEYAPKKKEDNKIEEQKMKEYFAAAGNRKHKAQMAAFVHRSRR